MNAKSARTCFALALLSLSLAAALSIGNARHTDPVTAIAHFSSMQLQAYDAEVNSAPHDARTTNEPLLCASREQPCSPMMQERALVRIDERTPLESRSRAPIEEVHPKSRN
jgi:hypothetical protein